MALTDFQLEMLTDIVRRADGVIDPINGGIGPALALMGAGDASHEDVQAALPELVAAYLSEKLDKNQDQADDE